MLVLVRDLVPQYVSFDSTIQDNMASEIISLWIEIRNKGHDENLGRFPSPGWKYSRTATCDWGKTYSLFHRFFYSYFSTDNSLGLLRSRILPNILYSVQHQSPENGPISRWPLMYVYMKPSFPASIKDISALRSPIVIFFLERTCPCDVSHFADLPPSNVFPSPLMLLTTPETWNCEGYVGQESGPDLSFS